MWESADWANLRKLSGEPAGLEHLLSAPDEKMCSGVQEFPGMAGTDSAEPGHRIGTV